MAKRILSKTASPAPPQTTAEILTRAAKELEASENQMKGLQSFLRALGEADASRGVVDINDLCFGFSYLLDATREGISEVRKLIAAAQKGGAA